MFIPTFINVVNLKLNYRSGCYVSFAFPLKINEICDRSVQKYSEPFELSCLFSDERQ